LGARLAAIGARRAGLHSTRKLHLRDVVRQVGDRPVRAENLPSEDVEYFGLNVLFRALPLTVAEPPAFQAQAVSERMRKRGEILSIDELVQAIGEFPNDLDRLLALFWFVCFQFKYDTVALREEQAIPPTDVILQRRKTVAAGFCQFMLEIAAMTISDSKIRLEQFRCYAKTLGYSLLQESGTMSHAPRANHVAIYVEIEGNRFLCDPTWAITSGPTESHWTHEFLIPMDRTLSSHYGFREAQQLYGRSCTFPQFIRQMFLHEDCAGLALRHESCPWDHFNVKKGFKKMVFSCSDEVQWISTKLEFIKRRQAEELSRIYTHARVIQQHGDRVRFELFLVFPEAGRYRCTLYLNGIAVATFHPFALVGCPDLPYLPSLGPETMARY
jgi:hypothetical protein